MKLGSENLQYLILTRLDLIRKNGQQQVRQIQNWGLKILLESNLGDTTSFIPCFNSLGTRLYYLRTNFSISSPGMVKLGPGLGYFADNNSTKHGHS
jgi:hypothetical protein